MSEFGNIFVLEKARPAMWGRRVQFEIKKLAGDAPLLKASRMNSGIILKHRFYLKLEVIIYHLIINQIISSFLFARKCYLTTAPRPMPLCAPCRARKLRERDPPPRSFRKR